MLRLAAARNAASLGLDERSAARSAPVAYCVPPVVEEGGGGDGDGVGLAVSSDGNGARCVSSSSDSIMSPAMLSSSASDKSRPMPSIESGEGRKGRISLADGREGGLRTAAVPLLLLFGPREDVVGLSGSDSSASSSISRADMERDSRSPRPPSAARMAGRPSATAFDPELSRERG